jgi:hypothetical protein
MRFFVLSSVANKQIDAFIRSSIAWARVLWKPQDDDLKKFEVSLMWDGKVTPILDKDNMFRRIDFKKEGSPKALQLVKENYSNPNFNPEVPVFVCQAAWYEPEEPGEPRDGMLRGFTLVKSLPWFTGERAILVFSSAADTRTIAHELTHWIGLSHKVYEGDPSNLAAGGSGVRVDRDEFRRLHRWATDVNYRKQLATK